MKISLFCCLIFSCYMFECLLIYVRKYTCMYQPKTLLWLIMKKINVRFWKEELWFSMVSQCLMCLCVTQQSWATKWYTKNCIINKTFLYVKSCNIFGQILNIWEKLILKKNFKFFFQCLALPKDPQSFGILIKVLQAYVVNM